MAEQIKGVTFSQVERAASEMLSQGIKPTVRGVIAVTGGKTEVVSKYLRDFFEKRDTDVSKMADEIGSSNVAKLISGEIQAIVDRKSLKLSEVIERQKKQIDELIELLEENVAESDYIKLQAQQSIDKATQEAGEKIDKANARTEKALLAQQQAEKDADESKKSAEHLVSNAEGKAIALVEAANQRAVHSEQETKALREQVKALSIDEAKREIERTEFEKAEKLLENLRLDIAEQKTSVAELGAENRALTKDVARLEKDNLEHKATAKEGVNLQTQLLESQKQITHLQHSLSVNEKERDSLTSALSKKSAG